MEGRQVPFPCPFERLLFVNSGGFLWARMAFLAALNTKSTIIKLIYIKIMEKEIIIIGAGTKGKLKGT